jgi:putative phosphoribosyl transferase
VCRRGACASNGSVRAVKQRERPFADRRDAGRFLAHAVAQALPDLAAGTAGNADVLVLGLARGGVPVAAAVAAELQSRLDVLIVRKVGLPAQPELAMGALAESADGALVVRNEAVLTQMAVPATVFEDACLRELRELRARALAYRRGRARLPLTGQTVLLVDDGLATGSSMRAAVAAVRAHNPRAIVVAVPVGAAETCSRLSAELTGKHDTVVCAWTPRPFYAVGQAYRDFAATSTEEVTRALHPAGPH